MSQRFEIVSINISAAKGTPKQSVPEALIDLDGLAGDAHAGPWHRQVSLLPSERLARFAAEAGYPIVGGDLAENLTTAGIDLSGIAPLDRFCIDDVELEVTQIGKACHGDTCDVFKRVGRCVMPEEGIFCRVVKPGRIRVGSIGEYLPRTLQVKILTLSDRAYRGAYEDKSGPRAHQILSGFFRSTRWHAQFLTAILPDESDILREEMMDSVRRGVDIIVTTGGTGVGPRDISPETVMSVCERTIPGLMEAIRMKYGVANPKALLSRAVAGTVGTTLICAIPGSVRAVEEYLKEILPVMEHLLLMMHGLVHD